MKTFRVLFNYLFLFTMPIWGPVVIVKHHMNKHYWDTFEEIFERCCEMFICFISPPALLVFLLVIRSMKVSGFNEKLKEEDKMTNKSVQNLLDAFKYGNYWAWQVFPDSYDIERDRKMVMDDCVKSLRKMSIVALGRDVLPQEKGEK